MSVSKKNGEGQYEEEFSGYAAFIGTAHTQAAGLKTGDRIKLGSVDVTSSYNRDKRERAFYCKVFSYEPADGPQTTPPNTGSPLDAVEDGGLPDDFPA